MQNENQLNTYQLMGIPDTIAVTFVLISLSLVLVPWFGGKEIGPLKVPNLESLQKRLMAFIAPMALVLFLIGFYPFWTTIPNPEKALRIALQAPIQVGDLLEDAPSLKGEGVYCQSARVTLIVSREPNTHLPIVVHSLTIRSENRNKLEIIGRCKIDPLSHRPYGIAEVDTYVVKFDDSSVDVDFIENRDSVLKSNWKNILYRGKKHYSVQLKEHDEPHVFHIVLNTEKHVPVAVWVEANFDVGGEFSTRTEEIVLWR